jgi:hypothetical protein
MKHPLAFLHKRVTKSTRAIDNPYLYKGSPVGYNWNRQKRLNNALPRQWDRSNGLYVPQNNPQGGVQQTAGVYGAVWRNDEAVVHLSNVRLSQRQQYSPPVYTSEKITNLRKIASLIANFQGN